MKQIASILIVAFLNVFCCPGIHAGFAEETRLYFPPAKGEWESVKLGNVGWDRAKLQKALDYAGENQSSGVVILYRGRILAEHPPEANAREGSRQTP